MTNGGPTPAQIAQVQTNLAHMQKLNDYVYNQGQSKVLNAYLLLSAPDTSDLGLEVGLKIFESAFEAVGLLLGPAGDLTATFLSGLLGTWSASQTPVSLNDTFSGLETRLQATSLALDKQLAVYYQDVASYWTTSFTANGRKTTLADLAAVKIPAETDPAFADLVAAALVALDREVWTSVLVATCVVTQWQTTDPFVIEGDQTDPPVTWDEDFIANNPAYYHSWTYQQQTGCGAINGWLIRQYNVGTGASAFSDGSLGDSACTYLFIDSADGVTINANGLFPRATVFTKLGIATKTHTSTPPGPTALVAAPAQVSLAYVRAMKEGRTLGQLIEREGRASVERRIIQRAQTDPVFAVSLAHRPRQTIERFLDVLIPEVVSVSAIVESPRSFGIVVPLVPATQK